MLEAGDETTQETPDNREAIYSEMQRFRSSLNRMIEQKGNKKYGSVTWELCKASIAHTHWQYLPIHATSIQNGDVENIFRALAKSDDCPNFEKDDIGIGLGETTDFFRVMIWDPSKPVEEYTSLVMRFDAGSPFDAAFGRHAMASLLKMDRRTDWRKCVLTKDMEDEDVEQLKEAFKEYDFT